LALCLASAGGAPGQEADAVRAAQGFRKGNQAIPAISDTTVLCEAECVEAIVEVTGSVEFAARVLLQAFRHGKHVVMVTVALAVRGPKAAVTLNGPPGVVPALWFRLHRLALGLLPQVRHAHARLSL
jgi:hypothetical protein